jgi:hypothetical protein
VQRILCRGFCAEDSVQRIPFRGFFERIGERKLRKSSLTEKQHNYLQKTPRKETGLERKRD